MTQLLNFLKTTITGGFLVVFPVVLVWMLLSQALDLLLGLASPIAALIPAGWFQHIDTERFVAFLMMAALCLLTGVAMRVGPGRRLGGWLERKILRPIPGYTVFRDLTRRLSGDRDVSRYHPALVNTAPGVQTMGFVVEQHDDGRSTVFIPFAPTPTVGSVYVVCAEALQDIPVETSEAINTYWHWGAGVADLFKK